MNAFLKRPAVKFNPGNGLLRNDHFQVAYCTNDLERACEIFGSRYGIKDYGGIEGDMPAGGYIQVKMAWAGGIMYEIVQADGPGSEFYNERLPSDAFAIRHHHLGFLIRNPSEWDALEQEIERGGWEIMHRNSNEGFLSAVYIDAPELGHYLEYIYPEAAGIAFFEGMPSS